MSFKCYRRATRAAGFLWCAVAAIALSGQAQAKPNFSGEYKLNTSKSEFGPMPAPANRTDKITHADPNLQVATKQTGQNGEVAFEVKYMTDGSETTNEVRNNAMKSTGKWDGDALVITTKANYGGNDITLADKWTLSEDGKVLTINRHITSPMGELDQKIVLEKQ
jgi:hypothetical protein